MEGGEIMVRGEGNEYKAHWSQHARLIVESSFLFINLNCGGKDKKWYHESAFHNLEEKTIYELEDDSGTKKHWSLTELELSFHRSNHLLDHRCRPDKTKMHNVTLTYRKAASNVDTKLYRQQSQRYEDAGARRRWVRL
ncbi:hypothetical protein YC2023_079352 [Brassica napus]